MKKDRKKETYKKISALTLAASMLFTSSCSLPGTNPTDDLFRDENGKRLSFAEAHDAFETTLTRKENNDDEIPAPPEGFFDLVYYPSKAGDLAAYISSDPEDGQKHPLIIWIVGGWGNSISEFPWYYPEWDNDQTGSAFWQAGVLTMYPSFRGGNGNPGYYETLFGEVDDIVSAYEYAASLPYVDPERIYLGGHSTGATRALLAAEYTDKFRSVFCFGAVDKIKYHNNSQFTFDTQNLEEHIMRSPIYWLEDVKRPTFLIEGSEGNGDRLKEMAQSSTNDNIHCYVLQGEDHFSVLAPLTRLAAQKILADTGAEANISITQSELEAAMKQEPVIPLPIMIPYTMDELGMTFSCPYLWELEDTSQDGAYEVMMASPYDDDNVWDMASVFLNIDEITDENWLEEFAQEAEAAGYEARRTTVGGLPAIEISYTMETDSGNVFNSLHVSTVRDNAVITFTYYIHESYGNDADPLFRAMIDSITFE